MQQRVFSSFLPLLFILALLVATVLLAVYSYHDQQSKQTQLVKQVSHTVAQLVGEPLKLSQFPSIDKMLQTFHHSDMLRVRALAVLDVQLDTVSASAPINYPHDSLPALLPTEHSIFSIHAVPDGSILAVHAVTQKAASSLDGNTAAPVIVGYVLFQYDALPLWTLDILPFILLFVMLALAGGWLQLQRQQSQQISALSQWLRQLTPYQKSSTRQFKILQPVADLVLEKLKLCHAEAQAISMQAAQDYQQLQQELQQKVAEQQQVCIEFAKVVQHCSAHNQQLKFWLELAAQLPKMTEAQIRYQTHILWLLNQLTEQTQRSNTQWFHVPDWLASSQRQLALFGTKAEVHLVVEEDPYAYQYRLQFDGEVLSNIWLLLVKLCSQFATEPDVLLSYRLLDGPQKQLRLSMKYVGAGFPLRFRQIVGGQLSTELGYQDADADLLRQLLRQAEGVCTMESLHDLGCQIEVTLPVGWQSCHAARMCQSILVLDDKECRVKILRQSLHAIGEQVHAVTGFHQLQDALKVRLVDLIVVVLPVESKLRVDYSPLLQQLASRYQILYFGLPEAIQLWQPVLSSPILPLPVLLSDIRQTLSLPPTLGSQQLLVVDDNLTNLSFVKAVLAGEGLAIDIAMTGAEAIKMASNNRYQLILMDIQLPDISGIEVTKRVRQLRHHQHTLILAFTAHALSEEIASFRQAGMDDVLLKPLDSKKIAHILSRLKPLQK
jgi:CheY-like chemotaxis protein